MNGRRWAAPFTEVVVLFAVAALRSGSREQVRRTRFVSGPRALLRTDVTGIP